MLLDAGFHYPPLDGSDLQTETSKEQSQRETETKICKPESKICLDTTILKLVHFKHLSTSFLYCRVQKQVLGTKPVERSVHGNRDQKGGVLDSWSRQDTVAACSRCPNPRKPRTHEKKELD